MISDMRLAPFATILLGAISLVGGSFLIVVGITQWVNNQGFGNPIYGLFPTALLGALFTFLSLPVSLYGFKSLPTWITGITAPQAHDDGNDELDQEALFLPLFSNKRIMGLSFVITAVVWLVLSLTTVFLNALNVPYMCIINDCPRVTMFTFLFSPGSLLLISFGIVILAVGVYLILISKQSGLGDQMRKANRNMVHTNPPNTGSLY